ncbi:MAG: hypothetical protein OEM59_08760 [Rhodospirillales bacterium]|nr:hypothetical protein [Rhodospirillales bacterium]
MITQEKFNSLPSRLKRLRAEYKRDPSAGKPPTIELLVSLLGTASDSDQEIKLASLLEGEYARYGLIKGEEALKRRMVERFPEEQMP